MSRWIPSGSMDLKTTRHIYRQLQEAKLDQNLAHLQREMLRVAVHYAQIRAQWALASREERIQMDSERTRAHDRLIDACNILSRNMAEAGLDISWRKKLGHNRKEIGDFACYLHALLGISAR